MKNLIVIAIAAFSLVFAGTAFGQERTPTRATTQQNSVKRKNVRGWWGDYDIGKGVTNRSRRSSMTTSKQNTNKRKNVKGNRAGKSVR